MATAVVIALAESSPQQDARFGSSLAHGKIDASGNPDDVVAGAPEADVGGKNNVGRVEVFIFR